MLAGGPRPPWLHSDGQERKFVPSMGMRHVICRPGTAAGDDAERVDAGGAWP